jgi:hypothetical protein
LWDHVEKFFRAEGDSDPTGKDMTGDLPHVFHAVIGKDTAAVVEKGGGFLPLVREPDSEGLIAGRVLGYGFSEKLYNVEEGVASIHRANDL